MPARGGGRAAAHRREALLAARNELGDVVGFGVPPRPDFWLGSHNTGTGFRESHIAFEALNRAAVHAFFDAAVAAGAEVLHAPRVWPEYHPNYFGVFVRDPDGNKICALKRM